MTEAHIQRAVFRHLRERGAPGVFAFHPANGGWRTKTEGAILKGLGVVRGVPDVIILHLGQCYGLELKAPGGRPTEAQLEVKARMEEAGAFCAITEGLDAPLRVLEAWGVLRGKTQ